MGMGFKDLKNIDDVIRPRNFCLYEGRFPETDAEFNRLVSQNKQHSLQYLDLGAQVCKPYQVSGANGSLTAHEYFNRIGINYTSIDISHSAEPTIVGDLRQDLTKNIIERFDVITNLGTSEHVNEQYPCWKNIHDLCGLNGYIVVSLPPVGNWLDHPNCYFWYTEEFFRELAQLNDYDILKLSIEGKDESSFKKLRGVLQKKRAKEFVSSAQFQEIQEKFLHYQAPEFESIFDRDIDYYRELMKQS